MNKQEYNGWTNYETWNVRLWMDNDQGANEYWREMAAEAYKQAEADNLFTRKQNACNVLAARMKDEIEDNNPLADQATMYVDLLNAALSEVNWYEIAESWITDELIEAIAE